MTSSAELTLDSLQDGPGLLPFKLGPTKVISHFHSFIQYIPINDLLVNVKLIKLQLNTLSLKLDNETLALFDPHLIYLKNKLGNVHNQLDTFQSNRVKRGLLNGLGSIIKDISGNLDYSDALRYDNAIKTLQDNEEQITSEFNNHISLGKQWMTENSKIINDIVINQNKIENSINEILNSNVNIENKILKFAHLAQYLLFLGDNIENLSDELSRLENILAFIHASSMHRSVLSTDSLKFMLNRLKIIYSKEEVLDLTIREYYDTITLGSFYSSDKIVIVFNVPVVLPKSYILYKLSIAPNINNLALIPSYPFIAIHENDLLYMEAECPKFNEWYLCEDKLTYPRQQQPDCIQQLIASQSINEACKLTSIILTKEAMEKLDDKHYVVSFPQPTKVQTSCGLHQHRVLQGSYLAVIPKNCFLQTPEFTIENSKDEIKGQAIRIIDLPKFDLIEHSQESHIKLNSINLENLHSSNSKITLQPQVTIAKSIPDSLYHTTIPMYGLLLSACALALGFAAYRYYIKIEPKTPQQDTEVPVKENDPNPRTTAIFSKILQ